MPYIPDAGDVVWLHFDPGKEKAGHRPAVVLSPARYNRFGLMVCCPVTTKIKGLPFEVPIAGEPASVANADQVKSLDWQSHRAKAKGRVSADELAQIRGKIIALIG